LSRGNSRRTEHRFDCIAGDLARINDSGSLETPYRKVESGKVSSHLDYLTADREKHSLIAQRNSRSRKAATSALDRVVCRARRLHRRRTGACGLHGRVAKQLVSVAASLIPFLEHDDAKPRS